MSRTNIAVLAGFWCVHTAMFVLNIALMIRFTLLIETFPRGLPSGSVGNFNVGDGVNQRLRRSTLTQTDQNRYTT